MVEKIAGVVVLYNPDESILENVSTYAAHVNKLYAVDNSENPKQHLISLLSGIAPHTAHIPFNENLGIGRALNEAADRALKDGYDWLLLMDQDSHFGDEMVVQLLKVAGTVNVTEVGIVAPRYIDDNSGSAAEELTEVQTVITSGSLLNLHAFAQTGPFREDLFIDFVDHEFCLRLLQHNFKILVTNAVKLEHKLGHLSCHQLFGRQLCTSNHNYIRRYYITRNRLEILRQFKGQFSEFTSSENDKNFVEIVKVLMFEKDKFRKLKSYILGYIDFKRRKFGRYNY